MARSKKGYLGRKDFTGKGRKSRRIDDSYFTKKSNHRLKGDAQKRAKSYRKKGLRARVVKTGAGWTVYTHTCSNRSKRCK